MKKFPALLLSFLLVLTLACPTAYAAPSPTEPAPSEDPNDPDSPDVVVIMDDDVPLTFIKEWDPEEEEFIYIPDGDTPLADMTSPQTGYEASYGVMGLTALAAAAGAAILFKRGKEDGAAS